MAGPRPRRGNGNWSDAPGVGRCDVDALRRLCPERAFDPGAMLREKGEYYRDMLIIVGGRVAVDLDPGRASVAPIIVGPGAPIGEIGFLRGTPATATVTARDPVRALVLDDALLARIEAERPALATRLLRGFARIAEDRTSYNLTLETRFGLGGATDDVRILLCRDQDMLTRAQQLRYDIYCRELGRTSPFADHDRGILADPLDGFAHNFIAVRDDETVGALRANRPIEGPLGVLEQLYGMPASPCHPVSTAVCTKFAVRRAMRGGSTALKLVSALAQYGLRHGIRECFIDAVPKLVPYYRAMGFTVVGDLFVHRENGLSYPMKIDLERRGRQLRRLGAGRQMLKLYVRARAITMVDRLRPPPARPEAVS